MMYRLELSEFKAAFEKLGYPLTDEAAAKAFDGLDKVCCVLCVVCCVLCCVLCVVCCVLLGLTDIFVCCIVLCVV